MYKGEHIITFNVKVIECELKINQINFLKGKNKVKLIIKFFTFLIFKSKKIMKNLSSICNFFDVNGCFSFTLKGKFSKCM